MMRELSLAVMLAGCSPALAPSIDGGVDAGAQADAGEPRDPGFDIPPSEWIDGGTGQSWGCYGRSGDRFIVRLATGDALSPWCASILFARTDGGASIFPSFVGPEGFEVVDARWALTCDDLELPTGALNHDRTRPVHELAGQVSLTAIYMGRPQAYHVDAGLRLAYRVCKVTQYAGMAETCAGP